MSGPKEIYVLWVRDKGTRQMWRDHKLYATKTAALLDMEWLTSHERQRPSLRMSGSALESFWLAAKIERYALVKP